MKIKIKADELLIKIRKEKPIIHHLTNWVTIYDCANITKMLGASPVMAHASEEVAEMAGIASALVLNIGTLTTGFVEAMKLAAKRANRKGIPVVLDVCGAGATKFRDRKSFQLLDSVRINILKGNVSEIARIAGRKIRTQGVDASYVAENGIELARKLAQKRKCTVVITGQEDIVTDEKETFLVRNGHPLMAHVVGTGCMATAVIGAFAAVEKNLSLAAVAGLTCYEIAAERAVERAQGPASFKERMFDCLYHLDPKDVRQFQRVYHSSRPFLKKKPGAER